MKEQTKEQIKYQEVAKWIFSRVKTKEKALFYEHMANLMDWWVTITDSLSSFIEKTNNKTLATYINNLSYFVSKWDNLSLSMKKVPALFETQEVALIEAWESTGNLVESLYSIADLIREKDKLRSEVKWALTYPSIIWVFLVLAIIIVMIFVVPKLMKMFSETWSELPLSTRSLIATSLFFQNNILLIIFFIIFWIFWIKSFAETNSGKIFFDKLYFNIPIVWNVYKNYTLAIISNNMWILMRWWISLMRVFDLTAASSPSFLYKKALLAVKEKVKLWEWIASSMEDIDPERNFFKRDFVQMIAVWEKTSSLDTITNKLSKYYSREVRSSLSILLKWIEPIAILIAWVFVVWFALAIFSAVMQLSNVNF